VINPKNHPSPNRLYQQHNFHFTASSLELPLFSLTDIRGDQIIQQPQYYYWYEMTNTMSYYTDATHNEIKDSTLQGGQHWSTIIHYHG
jgi:hypothetical protein